MKESLLSLYVHLMKLIGQDPCDSTLYCQSLLRDLLRGPHCISCMYVCMHVYMYVCMCYWPVLTHRSEILTWTKWDVSRLQTVEMEYWGNKTYKACLKSNATGAIKFINNWTKNKHHPFQSSFFGKPHTAKDVVPTSDSNAGSLHVEVLSVGLLRPFGCCPYFQSDDLWCGICVLGKRRSHTDRFSQCGGFGTTGVPFLVKMSFTEMVVWQGA
jgi:hypothetical protein